MTTLKCSNEITVTLTVTNKSYGHSNNEEKFIIAHSVFVYAMNKQIPSADWSYLRQWVQHCRYLLSWFLAEIRQLCLDMVVGPYFMTQPNPTHLWTNTVTQRIANVFNRTQTTDRQETTNSILWQCKLQLVSMSYIHYDYSDVTTVLHNWYTLQAMIYSIK